MTSDLLSWLPFIIALVAGIAKLIREGADYKTNFLYVVLTILVSAALSIVFAFFDAVLTDVTYTLDMTVILVYLFLAFIGSIIIPIVAWLAQLKIE